MALGGGSGQRPCAIITPIMHLTDNPGVPLGSAAHGISQTRHRPECRTNASQLGGLHASTSVLGTESSGQSPPSPRIPGAHELCGWDSSEKAHPLMEN